MSVKCPRCHSLVATDAVTGAPPEYCPYCDSPIAGHAEWAEAASPQDDTSAASAVDASADDRSEDDRAEIDSNASSDEASDASDETVADETAVDAGDIAAPVAEPVAVTETELSAEITAVSLNKNESAEDEPVAAPAAAAKRRKRAAPSFVRRPVHAAHRPTPRWFWAMAGGLALLAGLQIVLADRARLAADARWRPLIVSACEVLHCTVPPWREPGAFAMLGRDVRQHPYMPGALRVDATFRNNARWPQPWPELVLTLSDVDGRALGMRAFSPQEYLGKKATQKEIASGQSAAIRLEVMEPAAGVVSFSFDFH